MRTLRVVLACLLVMAMLSPAVAFGKGAKKYQVTGEVLAVTAEVITVQKGDEKWEINRLPDTKVTGTLKVGEKVTIEYTMTAASVEVKK